MGPGADAGSALGLPGGGCGAEPSQEVTATSALKVLEKSKDLASQAHYLLGPVPPPCEICQLSYSSAEPPPPTPQAKASASPASAPAPLPALSLWAASGRLGLSRQAWSRASACAIPAAWPLFLQVPARSPHLQVFRRGSFCGLARDCSSLPACCRSDLPPCVCTPCLLLKGRGSACAIPCAAPSSSHSGWTTVGVR